MVMQWSLIANEPKTYEAHWQGTTYVLSQDNPTQQFVLTANGKRVKQTWRNAITAFRDIDDKQNHIIAKLMKEKAANSGHASR